MATKKLVEVWICDRGHMHTSEGNAIQCEQGSKVTADQLDEIVRRVVQEDETFKALSSEFGVSATRIRQLFFKRCMQKYPGLEIPGERQLRKLGFSQPLEFVKRYIRETQAR